MGDAKKREYVLGMVILVAGIIYMVLTSQLKVPERPGVHVDATFVPYVLSSIMCILGVLQLRAAKNFQPEPATGKGDVDYGTVGKTIGLILGYVALLDFVGFPLMTVLYLVAQFTVLTPHDKKVNYVLYSVIAVLASAFIYLTFRYTFDMMLPVGPFDF
jgi:putative tricarboxylic transport membrane protein